VKFKDVKNLSISNMPLKVLHFLRSHNLGYTNLGRVYRDLYAFIVVTGYTYLESSGGGVSKIDVLDSCIFGFEKGIGINY
jgi:hypothetical protein